MLGQHGPVFFDRRKDTVTLALRELLDGSIGVQQRRLRRMALFPVFGLDFDRWRRQRFAAFGLRRGSRDLGNVMMGRQRRRCSGASHGRMGRRLGSEGRRGRRATFFHLCLWLLLLLLLLGRVVVVRET